MEDNVIENYKLNKENFVDFSKEFNDEIVIDSKCEFSVKIIIETEHGVLLDEEFKDVTLNKIKNRIFNFMDKYKFLKLVSVCRPVYERYFKYKFNRITLYKSSVISDIWTQFSNDVKEGKRKNKRSK